MPIDSNTIIVIWSFLSLVIIFGFISLGINLAIKVFKKV